MKTVPPIMRTKVSDEELSARVEAWMAAHPGYDATNYPDAFRDDSGELVENEAFFSAVELFSLIAAPE